MSAEDSILLLDVDQPFSGERRDVTEERITLLHRGLYYCFSCQGVWDVQRKEALVLL